MEQQARNLTDPVDGCLRRARHLIHDRDPLYTRVFGEILESAGVQPIRLPPKESQSQRLCRAVRQVDQRGVSHTRGPARRGASASSRLRVHRTLPSREKPPGTRQPAPATTTTSAKAGRRRSAAGTPRRMTQFLQSRGRMRGRPIKRTLRDRIHAEAAFAKLCGACPIPASSGMTTGAPPPRPRRSSPGQRRVPPGRHRADAVSTHPTLNYVRTTHR